MRLPHSLLTIILSSSSIFSTLTRAQAAPQATLLAASLPSCAQQCPVLQQAQTGCVPPAAPVTNQGIYTSCFCQSNYLVQLPSANVCAPQCSQADMSSIQSWFKSLCANGGSGAAAGGSQPTTTSQTTLKTTTAPKTKSATNGAGTGSATAVPGSAAANAANNQGWFQTHYRWVIMLLVLAIGLIAVAVAATMLHKRHIRRQEQNSRADAIMPGGLPQPSLGQWAPHGGSVHEFGEKGSSRIGAGAVTGGGSGGSRWGSKKGRGHGSRKGKSADRGNSGVGLIDNDGSEAGRERRMKDTLRRAPSAKLKRGDGGRGMWI